MLKNFKTKLLSVLGIAAMLGTVVNIAPASAAASPASVCGSGYYVQRSHNLPNATVYLMYNGSHNCVVTVKTGQLNQATRTTAGLQVEGRSWSYDVGNYQSYAGPVIEQASGKCVRFFGFHGGQDFTSAWGNCG